MSSKDLATRGRNSITALIKMILFLYSLQIVHFVEVRQSAPYSMAKVIFIHSYYIFQAFGTCIQLAVFWSPCSKVRLVSACFTDLGTQSSSWQHEQP